MKNIYLSISFLLLSHFSYTQNVGIGTASPQNKLEVSGSFGIKRSETGVAIWFNSGTDLNHVLWNDYFGGPITKGAAASGFDGIKWNTFGGIHFRSGTAGATERLIISDTENYINLLNSNVGVGNSTPRVKLSIGETIPTGNQYVYLRAYGNEPGSWKGSAAFGYTSASVIMGELNGVAEIGGHGPDLNSWSDLAINSGGGNVGIGTSTPQAKLHISGSVRFQGLSSSAQNTALMLDGSGNLSTRVMNISNWDAAHSWGNHASAGYLTSFSETDPSWSGNASTTDDISRTGNVGIGVGTNVNAKLNIGGNIGMNDNEIRLRGPADPNHILGHKSTFASVTMDGPLLMGHTSGILGTNLGGDKIALYWNNSQQVGIGTGTPEGSAHVFGGPGTDYGISSSPSLTLGNNNTDTRGYLKLYGTTAGNHAVVQMTTDNLHIDGSASAGATYINHYSQRNTIINGQGGNVGIGTTIPSAKLHVVTASSDGNVGAWDNGQFVVGRADASGTSSGGIGLSYNTSDNSSSISSLSPTTAWRDLRLRANNIIFMNGTAERARLSAAGNLGIGAAPDGFHRLKVNGRMFVDNGVIQRGGAAITATSDLGLYSRVSGNFVRYVTNGGDHVFYTGDGNGGTGSNEKMRINDASGVKIGPSGTYTKGMYHGTINVGDNNANNCPQCVWTGWSGDVLEIQIPWSSLGIPDGTNKTVMLTADGNNNSYNDNWSVSLQTLHSNRMDILIDRVDGSGWGLTTLRLHYIIMSNN